MTHNPHCNRCLTTDDLHAIGPHPDEYLCGTCVKIVCLIADDTIARMDAKAQGARVRSRFPALSKKPPVEKPN